MKKKSLIIILVLMFVCLIASISYAYYNINITPDSRKDIIGSATFEGCAGIVLNDKKIVSLAGDYSAPVQADRLLNSSTQTLSNYKYNFSVRNDCNTASDLTFALAILNTSTMPINAIKTLLVPEGTSNLSNKIDDVKGLGKEVIIVDEIIEELELPQNISSAYNVDTIRLEAHQTKNYDMYIWLDYNEGGQNNSTMDKLLEATFIVTNYSIQKYTITFNAGGGTGTMISQDCVYNRPCQISNYSFTKTDYAFDGWTGSNSSSYTNGQTINISSSLPNDTLNLTANWKPAKYYITFNANGGSGSMANQTCSYEAACTLTSSSYTKTGYYFNGWSAPSGVSYSNQQSINISNFLENNSLVLTAKWNPITYSVTYTLNGGTKSSGTYPASATYNSAFSVPDPTRSKAIFLGWKVTSGLNTSTAKCGSSNPTTSVTSSTVCKGSGSTTYFKNLTATNSGSVTLQAQWQLLEEDLNPTLLYSARANSYTFSSAVKNALVIVAGDNTPNLTSNNSTAVLTQINSIYAVGYATNRSILYHVKNIPSGTKLTTSGTNIHVYNLGTTEVQDLAFTTLKTLTNYELSSDTYSFNYTVSGTYQVVFCHTLQAEEDEMQSKNYDVFNFGSKAMTGIVHNTHDGTTYGAVHTSFVTRPANGTYLNVTMYKWAYDNWEESPHSGAYIGIRYNN